LVEPVVKTLPQAQRMVVCSYLGWIPSFISFTSFVSVKGHNCPEIFQSPGYHNTRTAKMQALFLIFFKFPGIYCWRTVRVSSTKIAPHLCISLAPQIAFHGMIATDTHTILNRFAILKMITTAFHSTLHSLHSTLFKMPSCRRGKWGSPYHRHRWRQCSWCRSRS